MNSLPIIGVFGLSGVGKSWLIARYVSHHAVLHVQASQLLREIKAKLSDAAVTPEDLRMGAVLDNQMLVVEAFARVRAAAQVPIIFDGHSVVDNGERLLDIPVEVIASLEITHLIFVEGLPQDIVQRRRRDKTRVRPERAETVLAGHQKRAKLVCQRYSQSLDLPIAILEAGDERAFGATVDEFLK